MMSIHIGYGGVTEQNDAILMARLATLCNYDNNILLTGENANVHEVSTTISQAAQLMGPKDKLFITISAPGTHGSNGPCIGLHDGTLSIKFIRNVLADAPAGAVIELVLDTSYAVCGEKETRGRERLEGQQMISISPERRMQGFLIIYHAGFCAATDGQHGKFTKAFYDNVLKERRISSMRYFLEKDVKDQSPYVEYVNPSKGRKMARAVFMRIR